MTNAPERIYHVSHGQFSVARHYGGCKAFGANYYHYDAIKDELVRWDIWQAELAINKQAQKERDEQCVIFTKKMQTGFEGF